MTLAFQQGGGRVALRAAICFLLAGVALEVAFTLWLNQGHFMFSLDDPYIHLALAENIAQGHYGVNMGDYSSPSSSIVWPFLLAPFASLSAAPYIIVALNTLCCVVALLLAWRTLLPLAPVKGPAPGGGGAQQGLLTIALVGFLFASNMLGLIFTGMEHALQLMVCVAIVAGLVQEIRTGQAPRWLWLALLLAPAIRYECMAIVSPVLAVLFWRGHRLPAVVVSVVIVCILVGFSAFLMHLGLPWLPNSVMAKLQITSAGGGLGHFVQVVNYNMVSDRGVLLSVGIVLLMYGAVRPRQDQATRMLAGAMGIAALLHLMIGRNGWYGRYELYIYGAVLLTLGYLYKERAYEALANGQLRLSTAAMVMVAGLLLLTVPYLHTVYTTPLAARNVYLQQYQMHRFVTEYYRKPVALNDLGWVSYRNDQPVLDLYGLASVEALKLRYGGKEKHWMGRLADRQHVKLAMLYEEWFKDVPPAWVRLGQMSFKGKKVTAAFADVGFFVTSCDELAVAAPALKAFVQTLPPGASFEPDESVKTRCPDSP